MVEFVTNILVIKNICEVINDSLINILFFLFLQIGPKLEQHYNNKYYKFI
jgi:hypothetical protein